MASKNLHHSNDDTDRGASPKRRPSAGHGLDAKLQEAIGRSLKAHYEDLVRAPVPGKFLEMLDRLEAEEHSKSQGGADGSG